MIGLALLALVAAVPSDVPDTPPHVRQMVAFDYPAASRQAHETGTVTYSFLVMADGLVTDCRIVKSSGFPRLDRETCSRATRIVFTPALAHGRPVAARQTNTVNWSLSGAR